MSNTYTQIHIQVVFAVRNRQSLISPSWEIKLHKYLAGIIKQKGHKPLQINGMPDHVHIFFGMRPTQSLSDLMRQVKGDSAAWVNKNGLTERRFSWQSGYGAFSYSKDAVPNVIRYIANQKTHHLKQSFQQEYLELLETFDVDYENQYLFLPVE
jgi:putative transposase